jgi:hypothetical protein
MHFREGCWGRRCSCGGVHSRAVRACEKSHADARSTSSSSDKDGHAVTAMLIDAI